MGDVEKLNDAELENAAGGAGGQDYVHNLANYVYKTVCNLPAGTCLVMQSSPGGPAMGVQYFNGNQIFVHKNFWENGYFLAYQNGIYGFVDARYVA